MLTLSYRLNAARKALSASFGSRAEMAQWLACMAQEGQTVRVISTATR